MKSKTWLGTLLVCAVVAAAGCAATERRTATSGASSSGAAATATPAPQAATAAHGAAAPQAGAAVADDGHGHGATAAHGPVAPAAGDVPAFETDPASLKSLPPTLDPRMFGGTQRAGYQAAKEIPKTLAQLPCYCHCDRGFGHKSLHSCFVDDHAAHCATCIDEALLALRLEKQEKLPPEKIRQRIIAEYSTQ